MIDADDSTGARRADSSASRASASIHDVILSPKDGQLASTNRGSESRADELPMGHEITVAALPTLHVAL